MKLPSVTKKFWIIAISVVVVASFLAFYLLIYVKDRESHNVSKNYRALDRLGKNILELKNSCEISIARFNDALAGHKQFSLKDYFSSKDYDDFKAQGIHLKLGSEDESLMVDTVELTSTKTVHKLHFHISTGDLLARSNIASTPFKDFFLIRIIHSPGRKAKDKTDSVVARIAYQTFSNRIEIKRIDSLVFLHFGIESIPLQDIVLAGTPYRIFSHRLKFSENEDWILCGATSVSDFKRTARSVNSYYIVFAVLIVLLVLLAMPVLKLLIMNSIERLRLINVWFAGFAIVVGTSVLLLTILATNHSLGYRGKVDNTLIELSDSVEARFLNELSDIHNQLTEINKRDIGQNIRTFPLFFTSGISKMYYSRENKPSSEWRAREDTTFRNLKFTYPFFHNIIWSDKDGDQRLTLSALDFNPKNKPFNLSKRYYFSNARDGKLWTLPHEDTVRKQFALQSIRSWVDGLLLAGFSIRLPEENGDAQVLSLITRLNSLLNPLLPPGYGFCIMDEKGEAWFHSETTKNTQENFIEEADRDDKIIAAIRGRMAIHFESSYHDEKHRMYVQPINNVPLYIIAYYDMNYYKAPLILTIGFALPITLIMFFLLGVQLFLQYMCVFKPTKLKIQRFYLYWLRPRLTENKDATKGDAMRASEKYVRAIATLAALALISTALLFIDPTVVVSFCLLVLPLYIFPFLYLLFEQESIQKDTGHWTKKNILFHPFVWLTAILIVLVNVALHDYIEDYSIAVMLQIFFILIMLVGFRWKEIRRFCEENGLQHQVQQRVLHRLYILMIFSWLLDVSILPVFSFYRTAFQAESNMWTKYLQWETANKELARQAILSKEYKRLNTVDPDNVVRERAKNLGNYLAVGSVKKAKGKKNQEYLTGYKQQKSIELHHLEFISRPQMEGIIAGTRAMLEASAADEKWSWFDHQSEPMLAMSYSDENEKDLHYYFFNEKLSMNLWASEYFVLFVVLAGALAVLIYRVTLFTIRSIFGLGVVMDTKLITESLREIEKDELLSQSVSLRKIFIVGLPYSGKRELLEHIKNSKKDEAKHTTMNDICEVNVVTEWAKPFNLYDKKMVILKNFDHGINNHSINQHKLEWMQTALDNQVSIVISSTAQPSSIIDFYEQSLQRLSSRDSTEKKQEYKQAMRQWKNILSGFVTYCQPLSMAKKAVQSDDYFVKAELEHGMYLPKLEKLVGHEGTATYAEQENFVLKVEELASTYYHSLWNSFSHDEKFLLYDLAKDRFVNLRNVTAIRMLLQKGIIVAGDSLQIMNKSFNDFILHVVNEDAEVRMQQELNQKGSWNVVYTVLIILVLGVLAFITLAQQNLLNDINLMLGVLGSLAAILTRFGGFLSNAPKKEQA